MKKIVGIIAIIFIIVGVVYWNSYTNIRTFDMDGYVFTSDNITNNLINGENVTKKTIDFSKVKYDDSLYSGRGKYFVGDHSKVEVNLNYPIISTDSKTLLILSDTGKLVDTSYRKTVTYRNVLVSDNKLFNDYNYERADNITYLFVELGSSIFVNLSEIQIKTTKEFVIPVNSFISFSEESLRYYYLKNGKYIYKEIGGLDKDAAVTFLEKTIGYHDLLERLGLYGTIEDDTDFSLPPVVVQEEENEEVSSNGETTESEDTGEILYVKPTVTFGGEKGSIYSMTGKLDIIDPTHQIVKYPTFEFWKGKTLFVRKTFVNSDTIEVKGLYPDTEYEVVGIFHYKNEKGQEVKSEFTRFHVATKDISGLETLGIAIDEIAPSTNYVEFKGIHFTNKISDEVLKGIKKVIVHVGTNSFQLGSGMLSQMIRLEKQNYTTSKALTSNTKYDVSFEVFDIAGNPIIFEAGDFSFKTSKQAPTGILAVTARDINRASIRFDITNKDDINIKNMHYTVYDSGKKLISDIETSSFTASLDNLDANEVYTVSLYGDYDLEDGQGILKNQLILNGKFTTDPISTLGYIRLDFSNVVSDIDNLKYSVRIGDETNERLKQLITKIDIQLKNASTNEVVAKLNINEEQFSKMVNGESIEFFNTNLPSNSAFYFDCVSHIQLGSKDYEVKTITNVNTIRTLRMDASIQVVNRFITESIIDFDVRVEDKDGAIQSDRVLMEARDNKGILIYYDELAINDDYVHISLNKLNKNEYYTFTYVAEEYNVGYDNTSFEGNKKLLEDKIFTEEGLFGSLAIETLLKQPTSKNLFDIRNARRWKTGGAMDVERRKVNLTDNTISLGAKNGYRTYSYYLPEYKNKTVTVSFKIKYADKNHMKPVYLCPNGNNNCTTASYQLKDIPSDDWLNVTKTFTINNGSPYVSFTIVEDVGENNITTILIKDYQIEEGNKATSYVDYKEKPNYMGTFVTNLTDRNHEVSKDDFYYYLRFYKDDVLVGIDSFDFNDSYQVDNFISQHEIIPSSNYNVKLSIKKRVVQSDLDDEDNEDNEDIENGWRYYDIANLNFTSDDEIRTIRTYEDYLAIHTSGFYLVAEDLDFRDKTSFVSTDFNGIIDFQGHKIYRDISTNGSNVSSAARLFTTLGSNGVLRNLDVHYYFDGPAKGEYQGLVYYNYGLIENLMITFEQGNNQPNTVISLAVRENYGIVRNFVVNMKESLSTERDVGLIAINNYGTIMNGYLYGAPINASFTNSAAQNKAVGVVARNCNINSYIANIYSLISVDISESDMTNQYQREVGNIIGPSTRSIVRNIYSYSEGENRNTSYDLNIFSGTMNVSNVYYATANDYAGTYSNKISPNALRQESFQQLLNADHAFDVENFVKYGYYPHIIWPDVMPNQEYIPLPNEDDGKVDFLSMEDRVELPDEKVEATLIFQNPGYDDIIELNFSNNLKAEILSQENASGKSRVHVRFYNPSTFVTKYSLTRIRHRNSAGFAGADITYGDKARIVEVDMYRNIHNMAEFNIIKTNAAQNFKLQTDLDFNNLSFTVGSFTGKLDGNGYTIKNIRETNNNFINSLSGGTVKNLTIDTYINDGNGTGTGTASYGGFIGEANTSANIDNVHIKNVSITDRFRYVGGLVGRTNGALISNCSATNVHIYETNRNNVVYTGRYGGLVGENNNAIIQNSFATDVNLEIMYASSTYGIGGLVGRHASGYIQDSYVEGQITTNQQEVGGVAGYNSGYIQRVVSKVDVFTQQDSVGGIVGYSTNNNVFNTLVVGGVYTAKDALNENRSIGNRTAVNSNYAWEKQLVNGLDANTANGDILLTTEELQSVTTYDSLIKFGDQFDASRLVNSKGRNLLPKLKYVSSDELLPGQKDIEYYYNDFKIKDIIVNRSYDSATIQIIINNPSNYPIKDLSIDGLNIVRVNKNITGNGESLYEIYAVPERYYDSYLINQIIYNDGEDDVKINPASKIDLIFYRDIATFEDWQEIDGDIYENYRLVGDIDFSGKSNVKTGVSFNRLEGTEDGHTISNISFSASSGHVGLIDTVASNISKVNFDNITIRSTSAIENTGIIRFLNGTMYDVNFSNINISSTSAYTGAVAFNQSPDIKRVNLNTVTVSGRNYVGGFIGYSRYFDITHVVGQHLTITGTADRVGGLIGAHENATYATMFNFTVDDATVKGTSYVGGIFGLGSCHYAIATNVHVTGTSYVGGIGGQTYFTYTNYGYVKDSDVTGSIDNIGGAYGYSYDLRYIYVDNVTVKGTRAGDVTNNVGGISGRSSYTRYYCGVKNSRIENAGNYTGGITGKLENAGLQTSYVYNTTVTGRRFVGGLVGWHSSNSSSIYYNISNATVLATSDYAGGFIGYMDNLNTTSATNRIYIYRNILAGSSITSRGATAGAFAPNSNKLPFEGHFYDNFISADVHTAGSGNISKFFIGNDDVTSAYTARLNAIRVYEKSTYNGVAVSTHNYPSNVTSYSLDQMKIASTFSALLVSNFNFTKVTSGKYPYLTYEWNNSGIQYFDLPPGIDLGSTGATRKNINNDLNFPKVHVYASDVDKINIEFSKVDDTISFKIHDNIYMINQLTYTYYYDFREDFDIILSDGINEKKITIKADDIKSISGIDNNHYYYIDNGKIVSDNEKSLESIASSEVLYRMDRLDESLNTETIPIHIYGNEVLLSNQNIYDFNKKQIIENSFENLKLTDTISLYHFYYGDNVIDTYYNYSMVNDEMITKQLFVKDNCLEVIDSSLNNIKDSILVDEYNGKNYLIYLGTDGKLYSLKDDIKFPRQFRNNNIKSIKSDIYGDSTIVFVLYENDDYIVFDYRSGKIIVQSMEHSKDLLYYFKSSFGNVGVSNKKSNQYQASLDLARKIEKKSISEVLGNNVENEMNSTQNTILDLYTSVYNPVTEKYEIYQIPNASSEKNTNNQLDIIFKDASTSNVIEANPVLYHYYIGKEKHQKNVVISVFTILLVIVTGIAFSIVILRRYLRKNYMA